MSYVNIFGGTVIQTADETFLALALSANTSLIWPLENAPSANVVADLIEVTPSANGFNLALPDATEGSLGIATVINNLSNTYSFTVTDNQGGVITTVAAGTVWLIYLYDNTTNAGHWRSLQYGAQAGSINLAAIAGSGVKVISSSLNQSWPVLSKSTNYVSTIADRAAVILWTGPAGTVTLPAAGTVGSDWFVAVRNAGSGDIVVSPPSGTIDGAASKTFSYSGASAIVFTDGSNWYTIGYGSTAAAGGFDYTSIDISGTGDYTIAGAQLNRISYKLTGLLTGNRNFVVPTSVQQYWINNATTGAFTVTVKTAAGTGVLITQGGQGIVYCDGTNVVTGVSGTSFPISVGNGGTGATTASAARTNLGSTATGDALFTAASASAARTSLGSTTVGDALYIAASASAALTLFNGATLTGGFTYTGTLTGGAWSGSTATGTGAFTATAFIPSGSTIPTNGMYLSAANTVTLSANSLYKWSLTDSGNNTVVTLTSSAATASAYHAYQVNGVSKGYVGVSGAAGALITTSALNDLCIRCDGTTIRLAVGGSTGIAALNTTALTAPAFIPTSATVPTNGMYLSAANTLAWATATTARLTLNATGNFVVNAPSAGVTMTVNNAAAQQALVVNGGASTPVFAIGNSSTAFTMDCSQSNVFTVTMNGNVAAGSLTISNIADGQTVNLRCTQDATGSRTLGNPTGVKWAGGVPSPILSTAANAVDIITFTRITGVTYAAVQNAFA